MDEIVLAFITECHENLEKLDNDMIQLEKGSSAPELKTSLARIFRTLHTIKGSCGWLGLPKLEALTHQGEDLIACLREGRLALSTEIVTTLLELFDAIRELLARLAATEQEGDKDYSALVARLKALQTPALPEADLAAAAALPEPETTRDEALRAGVSAAAETELAAQYDALVREADELAAAEVQDYQNLISNSNIRVDIRLLDKLMNLVGELVLARNQILQTQSRSEDAGTRASGQRLDRITSELQESVMKTRMQTIGTILKKLPRLVRDLCLECGKEAELEIEGEGTELDRTILEAILDPLTHIVRNAIDHGIEAPEERLRQGKPARGKIRLQAYHEGGHVIISLTDDGRGLSAERIRDKALQKGLVTAAELSRMPERHLFNLVFLPGFSTAEKVTSISGRGVGMDVVRHNIESIGGMIDLLSEPGQGTTLKIKIPLTLAIIPALLVSSAGERYAIPQVSLLELVGLEGPQARKRIEMIYNTPVYRLRGQLLPLVYLNQELGLSEELPELGEDEWLQIVVLQADDIQFGLVVDQINDTEEIVVKPLSRQLKSLSLYTGATILGDGKVALILDVLGLAQQAGVLSQSHSQQLSEAAQAGPVRGQERQSLLLLHSGDGNKMAMPLSLVARLEEFKHHRIEFSGDLQVIQYRKQILPLIYLTDVLSGPRRQPLAAALDDETRQVVVYTEHGRSVGLVVDRILDIVEADEQLEIQYSARRSGVLGSIVLQGAVTELLDIRDIIRRKVPSFFEPAPAPKQLLSVN